MSLIPRSNVIGGATADPYQVQPFADKDAGVQTKVVVLTASEMQAISSSSQELVEAPDDGSSIEIISIRVQKAANAYSGNYVLAFRYGTGANIASVPAATVTNAGVTSAYADPVAPTSALPDADEALNVHAANDYTGSGGDVTITVKYVLVKEDA